jgi:hypothetical protein
MITSEPLHLAALSGAEKDELIRNLWDDLRDQRARRREVEQRLARLESPTAFQGKPGRHLLAEL